MKRIFALILALVMLRPVTAFANSAPTHWRGSDTNGIIVSREGCPIVVEGEKLTFNIHNMPTQYHEDTDVYAGDNFVAEYRLHNPTDMEVTATVLFPFGKKGDYFSDRYITDSDFVNKNYTVQVDGQDIEKEKRYTFYPMDYLEFDVESQIGKISDSYIGDDFYRPDQKVTKYTIHFEDRYENKILKLDWENNGRPCILYTNDYHSGRFYDTSLTLETHFYEDVVYYIIGPGDNRPKIEMFEENEDNDYTGRGESVEGITTSREMTMAEFVQDSRYISRGIESLDIRQVDMDNIVADMFNRVSKGHQDRAFADSLTNYNIPRDLMGWYRYEITIPAGGTVVNTVSRPLFPDVNTGYEPDIFTYNYLLSPAGRWWDFKGIEIEINTPYYITENSLGEFEKTETGYKSTYNHLPDGELSFTICESEKPQKETNYKYLIMFLPILAVPVRIVAVLIVLIRFVVKKKK